MSQSALKTGELKLFRILILLLLTQFTLRSEAADSICDRSPLVVAALEKQTYKKCDLIKPADLANLTGLSIQDGTLKLQDHDLDGLTHLQSFYLYRVKFSLSGR